jgi:LPXTG-motif cell wall-anchored protein
MDTTTIVRIIAGILAVIVLAFVIYRRKHAKA